MQELRDGLKRLLEKRREAAQVLSDLDEQIEHVNKALGVGGAIKARKQRTPKVPKASKEQAAAPEGMQAQGRAVKHVDFSDGARELFREGN